MRGQKLAAVVFIGIFVLFFILIERSESLSIYSSKKQASWFSQKGNPTDQRGKMQRTFPLAAHRNTAINPTSPGEKKYWAAVIGGDDYDSSENISQTENGGYIITGFFSRSGQLTFTKEETELTIMPLGLGATYFQSLPPAEVYLALGVHYFQYKESNPIGVAEKGGSGLSIEPGVAIKLFRGVLLRVYLKYSYCRLQPADYRINIGGLQPGLALGYRF